MGCIPPGVPVQKSAVQDLFGLQSAGAGEKKLVQEREKDMTRGTLVKYKYMYE